LTILILLGKSKHAKGAELLSGHGHFRSFLHKINGRRDNKCPCGKEQTARHLIFSCPCMKAEREKFRTNESERKWPTEEEVGNYNFSEIRMTKKNNVKFVTFFHEIWDKMCKPNKLFQDLPP